MGGIMWHQCRPSARGASRRSHTSVTRSSVAGRAVVARVGLASLLVVAASAWGIRPAAATGLTASRTAKTIIAGGGTWSCALLANRTAKCWGNNSSGFVGDGKVGNTAPRLTPVPVKGISNAVVITMSCALLANGTAKCWGFNDAGEVGDGTTQTRFAPVAVKGLANAVAIASSYQDSCAVLANGTAKCWGQNAVGGVGDGTIGNRLTPVAVKGLKNAVAVATRNESSCALLANRTVKCWGNNDVGQLGDGTPGFGRPTPAAVKGLTKAVGISLADGYSCALLGDKTVKCWGASPTGKDTCGNYFGHVRCDLTPVTLKGLSNAIAISSGNAHSCALLVNRTVKCWGANGGGQLGDGTRTDRPTPVVVKGLTNAIAVSAGGGHSCAWLSNGTAKCWGRNDSGQLGNGTTTDHLTPVSVTGL